MSQIDLSDYRPVFYPQSLAVIGASDSPIKFGGRFLQITLSYGFKGKVYPVNPKGGTIQGLKAYTSVESIPDPVDFAVITVPAPFVLEAIRGCVEKGVKGAEILSAGFKEAGPEGEALEKEVVKAAREGGLRLVGPNCFGIHTPEVGLTLLPGTDFSTTHGPVGFFSQSGGGTCDVVYMALGRNIYFSVVISYGNACDIGAAEMLRYFEADPNTKIVGAYIEGVDDGRAFFEALKSCASKKPVVILKGGLSEQGYRGTLGHTGSMAGSKEAWNAAIKSAGAVSAYDQRDLVECLMAFNCLLDDETTEKIQAYLPPAGGRSGNPVDLANPGIIPATINPIMELLAERDDIDFLVMYQMLFYFLNVQKKLPPEFKGERGNPHVHAELTAKAEEIRTKSGKPLAMVLVDIASDPEHGEVELGRIEARYHYTNQGVPCFDTGYQAFSVLKRVADYYTRRQTKK
ncbi:MAG: CoA-binding protein [Deltaproteobacteria bacterium]|nr:CoA-binding protein [Deltaproteobacteria bacterium]